MADTAVLLVDRVLPQESLRQWVLSFPYPLRFLFATRPAITGEVLGIVHRVIAAHLIKKARHTRTTARAGAVTLIQRFGSALNLNIHFHMLFLDGVYVTPSDNSVRFVPAFPPARDELTRLIHSIARRVGRFLTRRGLLVEDDTGSHVAEDSGAVGPMDDLLGHAITYRIALGPTGAARSSPCKPGPRRKSPVRSWRSLRGNPAFHCMPGSRFAPASGLRSNACAVTSPARQYRSSGCH